MTHLLVVNRDKMELEVWRKRLLPPRRYDLRTTMRIALGRIGFDTPAGVYFVLAKAKNPEWLMPNSAWVDKEDRGKVIPGGDPANPIVGAFLKLTDDGVGIHGTNDLGSLGTFASHGCIRVHPRNALRLHRSIRKGTPCVIL